VAALALGAPAAACYKEMGLAGSLTISHPSAITVLLATRAAVQSGEVRKVSHPVDNAFSEDLALLYATGQYLALHGQTLEPAGPDYAVLLLKSGVWIGFGAGHEGGAFHIDAPAQADTNVLVLDEGVLATLLQGGLSIPEALSRNLVAASGPEAQAAAAYFAGLLDGFATSSVGAYVVNDLQKGTL